MLEIIEGEVRIMVYDELNKLMFIVFNKILIFKLFYILWEKKNKFLINYENVFCKFYIISLLMRFLINVWSF